MTRVIGLLCETAIATGINVPAHPGCPARCNIAEYLLLLITKLLHSFTGIFKDIGNFCFLSLI